MEDFILIGNDIIGLLEYRVKCGRAGKEGCIVDGDKRYYIAKDGSHAFNEVPAVFDKLDMLFCEILDLKYNTPAKV